MSKITEEVSLMTWNSASFFLESYSFILVGFSAVTYYQHLDRHTIILSVNLFVASIISRSVTVLLLVYFGNLFKKEQDKLTMTHVFVLTFSNLKGCLGFLLALDNKTTNKYVIKSVVYILLTFSLVIQGALLTPVFKMFDLTEKSTSRISEQGNK